MIEAVTRLKTNCGTPDYSKAPLVYGEAAKFIAYTGRDQERKYKSRADYTQTEDQRIVHAFCERINTRIGMIDAWGEMLTQRKRGQSWYAIEGQHTYRNRIKKVIFAFVEIEGKLYLGDID